MRKTKQLEMMKQSFNDWVNDKPVESGEAFDKVSRVYAVKAYGHSMVSLIEDIFEGLYLVDAEEFRAGMFRFSCAVNALSQSDIDGTTGVLDYIRDSIEDAVDETISECAEDAFTECIDLVINEIELYISMCSG